MKESKLPEVQENTSDQVTFGLSFEYDWLRRWYEFFFNHKHYVETKFSSDLVSLLNWKLLCFIDDLKARSVLFRRSI